MTIDEAIKWATDNKVKMCFETHLDYTMIVFRKDDVYCVIAKEAFVDPFVGSIFVPAIIALKRNNELQRSNSMGS